MMHSFIEQDEPLFACAISQFDTAHLCPHWPGYPVAVVAARLVALLGLSGLDAWRLLSVLCTTAVAVAVTVASKRRLALMLAPALPGAVLWGSLAFSDPVAILLGVAAIAALCRADDVRWRFAAPVLIALAVGARPSAIVLLPALFAVGRPRRELFAMVAVFAGASAVIWGAVVLVDDGFVRAGVRHLDEHFRRHGGSVTTDAALWQRPFTALRTFWVYLIGGWWPGLSSVRVVVGATWVVLVWRGLVALRGAPPTWTRPVAACVVAHLSFVLVVHDVAFTRYFLPLFPVVIIVAAAGLPRTGRARIAAIVALSLSTVVALRLHRLRAEEGSLEGGLLKTVSGPTTVVTTTNSLLLRAAVQQRPELSILPTQPEQLQTVAIVESARRSAVVLTFDDEALAPPFAVVAERQRDREYASRPPYRARLWRIER